MRVVLDLDDEAIELRPFEPPGRPADEVIEVPDELYARWRAAADALSAAEDEVLERARQIPHRERFPHGPPRPLVPVSMSMVNAAVERYVTDLHATLSREALFLTRRQ